MTFKRRQGSAVLEYVLVLPIIFLVLMLLIVMLIASYDQTVLDGATSRGALQARKMLVSPQYSNYFRTNESISKDVLDFEEISGFVNKERYRDIQPYRYFFYSSEDVQANTESIVEDIIKKGSVFNTHVEPSVTVKVSKFVVHNTIEVTATKQLLPTIKVMGIELPELKVSSYAKTVVNDPVDFIRNVDLANEILEEVGVTGQDGKVAEMFESVKAMLSRFFP